MVTSAQDPNIDFLPGVLRPLATACGLAAVEALVEAFGGTRLYVPKNGRFRSVADKCGQPLADLLQTTYAGEYVVLPLARSLAVARKHAVIKADPRSATEIARTYKMSVNSVHRIRGKDDVPVRPRRSGRMVAHDDRQIDLVDYINTRTQKR